MDKEEKSDNIRKTLSEMQYRVQALERLNFVESLIRFEETNGRKPTRDERKDMAKDLHISLDDFCALLKDYSFDDTCRAIGLAWSTRGPGLRESHPRV